MAIIKASTLFKFIRYGLVGAIGTVAHYGVLVGAVSMHIATPVVASMAGATLGAVINYILNARYTFNYTGHAKALPKFSLIAIAGALTNGILMKILIDNARFHYLIAQLVATLIVLAATYTVNSLWTFRPAASEPGSDETSD